MTVTARKALSPPSAGRSGGPVRGTPPLSWARYLWAQVVLPSQGCQGSLVLLKIPTHDLERNSQTWSWKSPLGWTRGSQEEGDPVKGQDLEARDTNQAEGQAVPAPPPTCGGAWEHLFPWPQCPHLQWGPGNL